MTLVVDDTMTADEMVAQAHHALSLAEDLEHRRYVPHAKQQQAHASRARVRGLFTGNRFGKTDCMVNECRFWATGVHPYRDDLPKRPTTVRAYCDGYDAALKDVLIPKFERWFDPDELAGGNFTESYNKGERVLRVKSVYGGESTIKFLSHNLADSTRSTQRYEGTEVDLHAFDEHGQLAIYRACGARIGPGVKPNIFIAYTPLLGTAAWEYDEVYMRWQRGEPGYDCITGSIWDNERLPREAIEEYLNSLPAEEREIRELGVWRALGGAVYAMFDDQRHVVPYSDEIVSRLTKTVIIDPHPSKPTAVLWCGIDQNNKRYAYREMFMKARVADVADAIRMESKGETITRFIIDKHWGWDNTEIGDNLKDMYERAGITPLHLGYDKEPPRIERLRSLLSIPGVGDPGLFIMKSCPELARQVRRNQFKPQTTAMQESDRWKRIEAEDDLLDCLEYYVMSDDVYLGGKVESAARVLPPSARMDI